MACTGGSCEAIRTQSTSPLNDAYATKHSKAVPLLYVSCCYRCLSSPLLASLCSFCSLLLCYLHRLRKRLLQPLNVGTFIRACFSERTIVLYERVARSLCSFASFLPRLGNIHLVDLFQHSFILRSLQKQQVAPLPAISLKLKSFYPIRK